MKKIVLRLLDIEPSELIQVILLLVLGFLTGVFLASYDVATMTLFVENLDEEKDLPYAVIATGLVGVVVTYIFSFLQSRVSYSKLSIISLFIVAVAVWAIRLSFGEVTKANIHEHHQLIFIAQILLGPIDAIVLLVFWGTIARMFSLKQQKRIVGGVDVGKGLATLVAFFAIPILSGLISHTVDLLYFSGVSSVLIILVLVFIIAKSPLLRLGATEERGRGKKARLGFVKMIQNPYVLSMVGFVIVAVVSSRFVDYSFLVATGQQYPDEKDLQNFLAVFQGIIIIFALLAQIFITDRVTELYGFKIALLINPILLILLTVIAILVGSFFGFDPKSGNFLLFFLAISLSKLFTTSLKDSVDDATFKFFYFPIDANYRLDVIARMDGVIRVGAGLIAGGLMIGLQYFKFSNLLFFSILSLPIMGAWAYIISKMYQQYRETLRQTLINSKNRGTTSNILNEQSLDKMLQEEVKNPIPERTVFALKLMERLEPALLEKEIIRLAADETTKPEVKEYVLNKIEMLSITPEGLSGANNTPKVLLSNEEMKRLVKSRNIQDRIQAAKVLPAMVSTDTEFLLLELLRDVDIKVRLYAINAARKIQKPETWSILIELLASPLFANAATAAIIAGKDAILPALEASFHKSGQKEEVMAKIVQIYGRIGSEKAIELLWSKINYPDPEIVEQVLFAFSYNKIKAPQERTAFIKHIIEIEVGDAAWDIAARSEIKDVHYTKYLQKSLDDEIGYNYENLFVLLALMYDEQSVQLVKQNLESDSVEAQVFAIELLDVFLEEDIKPKLFPILEDISVEDKIEKLQEIFPRDRFNSVDVLKHLISRDYAYTNRWTRACAIYALGNTPGLRGFEEIEANLFHPDPLLHETSAWAICMHDRSVYEQIKPRLPKENIKNTEAILEKTFGNKAELMPLRLEKTMFLKEISFFQEIPSDIVSELVELVEEKHFQEGDIVISIDEKNSLPIYIVARGRLAAYREGIATENFAEREILGHFQVLDDDAVLEEVRALEQTTLYKLDKDLFYEMITKNHELARAFIDAVGKRLEPEVILEK